MEYLQCLYAFASCVGFCILLNVRGQAILWTSLGGAIGWFFYLLCAPAQNDILQYFVGTLALAVYAEVMARVRKAPATGYLHVALLPMVPGGGIYYTMEYGIAGNTEMFLETGMHTLGIAGALALGILVVSTLARVLTLWGEERRRRAAPRGK